jgi:hypothetical protein
VTSTVSTVLPPDEVIIERTEISGMDAFEEVVTVEDIVGMKDPLRELLLEPVKKHAEKLLPPSGGGAARGMSGPGASAEKGAPAAWQADADPSPITGF